MNTSGSKTRELWGRKLKIVKNGLDEAEVSAFIGGLIDQNNALASKLEHLHSLTELAERTVVEASKQAQSITKEAEEKAAGAASIITEAEEKARKETERITSEGERNARQSAQEKIAAAEQQAQSMLATAEEKAKSIKLNASDEANKIIAEAKQSAVATEQQAQEMLKATEEKAESIKTNATDEADRLIAEAKQKILATQQQAQEKLKKVYQELLSGLEEIDETAIMPPTEEGKESEPAKPEPVVHVKAERKAKRAPKQFSLSEEKVEVKESPNIYEGNVELVISPPIDLDRMLQLHKHVRNIPNIEVLSFGVSPDKSVTIRVSLENPTPLRKILEDLPEVETTADTTQDSEMTSATKKTGESAPVRRIMVTAKKIDQLCGV